MPRWLNRTQVEEILQDAGMPHSRATIERLMKDETLGFPQCRRLGDKGRRMWDRRLVEAWVVRSRCSEPTPGEATNGEDAA